MSLKIQSLCRGRALVVDPAELPSWEKSVEPPELLSPGSDSLLGALECLPKFGLKISTLKIAQYKAVEHASSYAHIQSHIYSSLSLAHKL